MTDVIARRLRVRGRVQGVFFRASTRDRAEQAGVRGWVRNQPDGSVEAWLEGPADAVAQVESWIRAGGPQDARVDEIDVRDVEAAGYDGFAVGEPGPGMS